MTDIVTDFDRRGDLRVPNGFFEGLRSNLVVAACHDLLAAKETWSAEVEKVVQDCSHSHVGDVGGERVCFVCGAFEERGNGYDMLTDDGTRFIIPIKDTDKYHLRTYDLASSRAILP